MEAVINGFGRHIETISAGELVEQGKVAIGGIIFYVLTHMALKLSILLQYVRISVMPFEKRFCYVIIVILIAVARHDRHTPRPLPAFPRLMDAQRTRRSLPESNDGVLCSA